jgi:hypothetical protein
MPTEDKRPFPRDGAAGTDDRAQSANRSVDRHDLCILLDHDVAGIDADDQAIELRV